ncbi:MAG: hypothetical protein QM767_12385 [Anaeromyxobacter sp.]
MKKIILGVLAVLLVVLAVPIGARHWKDIRKKLAYQNTYAIQNVQSGKDLRPLDAGIEDGTGVILYDHHDWECMTWQLIQLEGDTYLVKNLFTQKAFQPGSLDASDGALLQQTMGGTRLQHWEFLKQPDETYLIRLRGSELYLTAPGQDTNSPARLLPRRDSRNQAWRLVRQTPWI